MTARRAARQSRLRHSPRKLWIQSADAVANTAQWLNWQCGIEPEAAREKVRVARSLEQLPEIADAFANGEISYPKVRARPATRSAGDGGRRVAADVVRTSSRCGSDVVAM